MKSVIQIILIEDHDEFRNSLQFLLNSSNDIQCSSHSNVEDALLSIPHNIPDVVIMDINLPGLSGIEGTRLIREKYPEIQVMMCSVYDDSSDIFAALQAGANGYILKRAPIQDIFDSIQQLMSGGSPMTTSIARKVVASFQKPVLKSKSEILSDRENEILDLLATGLRLKEIADELHISINTVRTHIRHIYEKLQVQSRVEALNKARKSKY